MILSEIKKHLDADMLTLLGEFKLQLIGNSALMVQNFIKIITYTSEQVVFKIKNNEVTVSGENFKLAEMGSKDVTIIGKIKNISFSRWAYEKV